MLYAIRYRLYNLKNVKNLHEEVLLLVKMQVSSCYFTKNIIPTWVLFTFFYIVQMVSNRAKRLIHDTTHTQFPYIFSLRFSRKESN